MGFRNGQWVKLRDDLVVDGLLGCMPSRKVKAELEKQGTVCIHVGPAKKAKLDDDGNPVVAAGQPVLVDIEPGLQEVHFLEADGDLHEGETRKIAMIRQELLEDVLDINELPASRRKTQREGFTLEPSKW